MVSTHGLAELGRRAVVAAFYAAVAAATAAIVRRDPDLALAGASTRRLAAELIAGALLAGAALVMWRAGARFAPLLAAAALAWPLWEWGTPGAGIAFSAGLALYAAWPPLLAAAAWRGVDERRTGRLATVVLALAFVTNIGVLGLASAAVFDPRAQGCADCPANHLLVAGSADTWRALGKIGLALGAGWSAAFAALAVARLARSSPWRRRLIAPTLVPATAALLLFGLDAAHGLRRGFVSNDGTDRVLLVGEMAALTLVAVGVAWDRVRARRRRSALARLVVDLGGSPSHGTLRERLAAMLGDPTLDLLHARDDASGWLDGEGRPASLPIGGTREVTRVVAGGHEVSALVHRPGLFDDPALAEEIAVVVRLALEHERLHASRRAHLEALRASRARVVAVADGARRRLERDLHDGAQQRLVTLAVGVRLARRRHGAGDVALDDELAVVEQELRAAVGELRHLAHGLFPAALDLEGFAAAVELLAEEEPRLVPGALSDRRCEPAVESAAYYMVDAALRATATGDVSVSASCRGDRLFVDVSASGELDGLPIRVSDRIGAVGGTLAVDGGRITAELPCAS